VSQEAPGRLEVVRAFVNSVDLEEDEEQLDSPEALGTWLAERELLGPGERPTAGDLERAVALREALRQLLLAHHAADDEPDPAAVETVEAPGEEGTDGALGRLLAIVAEAQADGTWSRLKACPWDTCRWAFYDHSRNRSGVWCNMAVCGNRAKAQAYRQRRRGPAHEH
jgi:predicted RNA-binding Zn ribbon-like protein